MKMHLHQQPYPCNPYKRRRGKGGGKLAQVQTQVQAKLHYPPKYYSSKSVMYTK
jgi:hypothetical protein